MNALAAVVSAFGGNAESLSSQMSASPEMRFVGAYTRRNEAIASSCPGMSAPSHFNALTVVRQAFPAPSAQIVPLTVATK